MIISSQLYSSSDNTEIQQAHRPPDTSGSLHIFSFFFLYPAPVCHPPEAYLFLGWNSL